LNGRARSRLPYGGIASHRSLNRHQPPRFSSSLALEAATAELAIGQDIAEQLLSAPSG
jgi:hypothetical protein